MTLRVEGLALARADGATLLAPLDLRLEPGDRRGLVGESGSGKSLLVQAVFGVLPPGVAQVTGHISAFGVPMDRPHPDRDRIRGRRLAWVPQDPLQALNPFLRAKDQLALLPGVHLGESPRASLARLSPLLERLRLPRDRGFLHRHPHDLSGGQRQRLVLAMALSCDPDLLILDEPTTALDPTVQAEFLNIILELQKERNLGYLWISHDLGVVASVTERILVLYGGQAMEAGSTSQVLSSPRHPYTRRLLEAARREPAREAGYLPGPGERLPGCPFRGRCAEARASCCEWRPWQGDPDQGLRCEAILAAEAVPA